MRNVLQTYGETAHGNVDDACGAHFDGIALLR